LTYAARSGSTIIWCHYNDEQESMGRTFAKGKGGIETNKPLYDGLIEFLIRILDPAEHLPRAESTSPTS